MKLNKVPLLLFFVFFFIKNKQIKTRGGEISKMYSCPRTTGCKKALVRTKALLARIQINTKARFVNIMTL